MLGKAQKIDSLMRNHENMRIVLAEYFVERWIISAKENIGCLKLLAPAVVCYVG